MLSRPLPLNGVWRFQPDLFDEGEALGYPRPDGDCRRWREAAVPGTYDQTHGGLQYYEGAAWYRRTVAVPADWAGRRVLLRFHGVGCRARVWVNGHDAGAMPDGLLPFDLPVDALLLPGAENVVVVRTDNRRLAGEVPGLERGWRTFGGILREVELVATERLYLANPVVRADPRPDGGQLEVVAQVCNDTPGDATVCLRARLLDPEGHVCAERTGDAVALAAGRRLPVNLAATAPGAQPWSPGNPRLYTLSLELSCGGRTVHTETLRCGFRKIEARGERLFLNGNPLRLAGFNRHEDSPSRDMAPDRDQTRRDLEAMKDAGANFVRLCHYPHHPAELDLCDELGLLAMAEIPLYWWNGTAEGEDACRRKLAAAERQLQTLIQRDRNHPSVIFWSVSNETEEQRPEVADGNRRLVRFARQLDPTRLAVHVSNHWQENPQFEDDDVVCVNAYPSLDGCAARGIRGTDLAGSTCFWQEGLATLHARVPGKPVLVTEFGSASLEGVFGTGAGEDTHAAILERESAGMQAPYVCGATVWCWADHAWPPAAFAYMKHLGTSPYGVVTRDRRSLAPLAAARRVFRPRAAAVPPPAPPGAEPPGGWPVTMIRPHLRDLPPVQFPPGFGIRAMRVEEAGLWADIEQDAEGFLSIPVELFFREFGEDLAAVPRRCFILTNEKGCGVGTVSAWYNRDFRGQDYGRIHWVAVRPAWQRRGLARAGLAYAMHALAQWHERCYLATSTARLPAIRLYLDFGFEPDLEPPGAREAWAPVLAALGQAAPQG